MNRTCVPVLVSAALLCLTWGCEKDQSTTAPSTSATAQPVMPMGSARSATSEHPRNRMHPGEGFDRRAGGWWNDPAAILTHAAVQDPSLTDEQRDKIKALHGTGDDAKGAMPAPMAEFHKALADAVKAGKIDEKTFEPQLAAMQKAGEEGRAARAKRLTELHDILTPEQRKTAADMVRKRLEEGPRGMMGMGGPPAGSAGPRGMMGMGGPPPGPEGSAGPHRPGPMAGGSAAPHHPGPMPGGSAGPHHGGPMEGGMRGHHFEGPMGWLMMSQGLDLTEAQQKKVDALAQKAEKGKPTKENMEAMREEFKTNMTAMLDAFEKDTFDATTLALFKAPEKPASDWMKGHVELLSSFVAILTPEQRDKLADRLSKPGEEWRRMDPGGPRPGYWNFRGEDEPEK